MSADRTPLIQSLFDEYIEMYSARDDRLTQRFSENFTGYAGSSDQLVKSRDAWIAVTRLDFAQVKERVGIEMLDIAHQDLADDVVAVTAFFRIHLPTATQFLEREIARLVLVFRREGDLWMIAHSGISVPFSVATQGEVYPLEHMQDRTRELEVLVEQRTRELRHANDKLDALSNLDGLTGIANRRKFDAELQKEWSREQRQGTSLSLIMLDVDLFKKYNDHYGHQQGDECLKALGQALTRAARRSGDLVARYGGEEFVVLLPNASEHDAIDTAKRIQHEVALLELPHAQAPVGRVTFSLGVASMQPSSAADAQELVGRADAALYRAKGLGRNRMELG